MRTNTWACSFRNVLSQFLTPPDWRQVHRAWRPKQAPSRWALQALAWVALAMAFGTGDTQEERFVADGNLEVLQLDLGKGFDSAGIYVAAGVIPGDRPGTYWFYYSGYKTGHDKNLPGKVKFDGGYGRFLVEVAGD